MSAIVLPRPNLETARDTLDEVKICLRLFRRLHNGERQPEPVKYRFSGAW